ncbi:MAG: type IV toxin-antitoxin system AbiEi family antitoxin domain-containing protein [Verrucomicrobia bacterium]|jgi:hypothetical protein|nr:type IV toxin-antitoxin system AbiEi family antitoxin domain-containing protein [Verrucomicrobiota bacterium]
MTNNQIKRLQNEILRGSPFDTARLQKLGISTALAHRYVKSGWLDKLGRGIFMFPGDVLNLETTLCFLEQKDPALHVAVKTALDWRGFRHNLAYDEKLILWGSRPSGLPDWFQNYFPNRYSASQLFDDKLPSGYGVSPLTQTPDGPQVSEPERALLEMLSEVGVHQEVDEARHIMESVRQLRTATLCRLLESCRMVKAVRLCVGWAKELELPWATQAREAAKGKMGTGRWVTRLKDGSTLILKP